MISWAVGSNVDGSNKSGLKWREHSRLHRKNSVWWLQLTTVAVVAGGNRSFCCHFYHHHHHHRDRVLSFDFIIPITTIIPLSRQCVIELNHGNYRPPASERALSYHWRLHYHHHHHHHHHYLHPFSKSRWIVEQEQQYWQHSKAQ